MLRDEGQKELDRTFTKIEAWGELLTRWDAIDTEQEAVGLLYAGTTINDINHDALICGSDPEIKRSEEVEKRVKFYLRWSSHSNETISCAAQQLIVKHWLKQVQSYVWDPRYSETCRLLVEFLSEQRKALLSPPHPKFIAGFLLRVRNELLNEQYLSCTFRQEAVRAILTWGLGYLLAEGGYIHREFIPLIKEFLEQRNSDSGHVFLELSGHGEPMPDLKPEAYGTNEVNKRAALALMKLEWWIGEGVHESRS